MGLILFWNRLQLHWISRFVLFSCCLFLSINANAQNLLINEILASTDQTDQYDTSLEWIEIYNPGPRAINLVQYTLTDDPQSPRKWNFPPVTLQPNQYFLVYATAYDYYNPGEYHTNFRLDADGEYVGIYLNADLTLVDSVTFPAQQRDVSYGRDPVEQNRWVFFQPTPQKQNATGGKVGNAKPAAFSLPGGMYSEPVILSLTAPESESEIRYTLDGTSPTQKSPLYAAPIRLEKTTPVRARVFRTGYGPSDITTHTFFIGDEQHLPVISLVTDPPHLWDRRSGIYANATQHGFNWERPVSMEFFKREGSRWFGVNAGLRIHGGASRKRSEKKSFRVYFRSEYGPGRLKYPVIPSTTIDDFDSFILRAGYNDSWVHWDAMERKVAVYISDQMGRDVHGEMGSVSSHGIYTELYLNGEYWGLYNLCERIDSDFLDSYYGDEEWDIISDDEVKEGDGVEWSRLRQFVSQNDLRNADNYQQLLTLVDIEQITSYYILNIWVQNHDWPHHNWFAARERKPDGKWKFLVWDIEDSFGSGASRGKYTMNTFTQAQQGGILGTLFKQLLRNPDYQLYFKQQLDHYLETVLNPDHLLSLLDSHADRARPAIPFEAERWNPTKGLTAWNDALDIARTFINRRTDQVLQHVSRALRLPTPTPTPKSTPTPGGPTPTPTRVPTATPTPIQPQPGDRIGLFDGSMDIGDVSAPGEAVFDAGTGEYFVTGSGMDIWGREDEFHFLYRKIRGDFSLEATMDGENFGTSPWAKIALMAREMLEPDARHFVSRLQESTRQASSQWRMEPGSNASSTPGNLRINADRHDGRLRLVRRGNTFSTYYYDIKSMEWTLIDSRTLPMSDPIYVGLAVTSHEDGSLARGTYKNVILLGEEVPVSHWMMY